MAEYDLTQVRHLTALEGAEECNADTEQTLIPHLDRHLVIPLLDHLSESDLFPVAQIAKAQ